MSSRKELPLILVVLFVVSLSFGEWQSYAQGRFPRKSQRTFEEEDLAPDSRTISPEDEFGEYDDEESPGARVDGEAFSEHDSRTETSRPSMDELPPRASDYDTAPQDERSEEWIDEPPITTSGPPVLPDAHSLLPQEQVALSFVTMGAEAMGTEDIVRARALFERAIEIAPLQPYSYFFLGRLALKQEEHQKALPLLRKAEILLTGGDQAWRSEAVSAQGAVYEDLGELPQARRAYRRSLRFFPHNLRAMSALARLTDEEVPGSDDAIAY